MAIDSTTQAGAASSSADLWATNMQQAPTDTSNAAFFADLLRSSQVEQSDEVITSDSLAGEAADSESTEDQFLTLLLAQMNNQDPLNPLENAEVTSQLAQISTVSGIESLNSTMNSLLERFKSSNPVDSAAMIDRKVLIAGDRLTLPESLEGKVQAGAELKSAATEVAVQIIGADGQPVRELALGPQAAGTVTFEWDGLDDAGDELDAGEYSFQVIGQTSGGLQVAAPLIADTVTGITRSGDSLSYRLANGTTVSADNVNGVL